ncbi:larval cuticle protein 65Ag1-like [Episyrphus balteatus]|uniref:larval cuticle protein 65Ag1-like n=1 Tax=Episyrphus balteatus TaxID=286459 RepID=UPI0024867473|nr:larval cuticle protein 65Ag1-like [Episyrphus balteatus]
MKFVIVFVALFGLALAAVITREEAYVGPETYPSVVESDRQAHLEEGQLKNIGSEDEAISNKGQYSYVGPNGVTYKVTTTADENGFQTPAAHLPVAPESL